LYSKYFAFLIKTEYFTVVTGASSGIGKYYAIELAKRRMNVILISKNLEKLKKVEEEISKKYTLRARLFLLFNLFYRERI